MGVLGGLNAWAVKSNSAKKKIKQKAGVYVQAKTKAVLLEALRVSPQWSGNFAANWDIVTSLNGQSGYTKAFKVDDWHSQKETAHKVGDRPAIAFNLMLNQDTIDSIKWNTKISITNNALIADDMEAGNIKLRPENAGAETAILAHLKQKFPYIK